MLLNGPESFTPDGNFILGEAPELRNYFVAAGFNSAGIANAGGAGTLIAEWIVGGEAPIDLCGCRHPPLRRRSTANRRHARRAHRRDARPALRDALAAPGARDRRGRCARSPLYDLLAAKGAVFGAKIGWERANYFRAAGRGRAAPVHARQARLAARRVSTSSAPTATAVALFDQTSFGKIRCCKGRDALAVLQRLCANEIDVAAGRMVYTAMLNERGGFESDLTVHAARAPTAS